MLNHRERRWTKALPLLLWIGIIFWIASRPSSFFFQDKKLVFEMPRRFIQYPYHLSAFFILNFLFSRWLFSARAAQTAGKIETMSLIGCVFVSIGSEIIQLFVPTRTPAVTDLGLDLIGALFALLFMRRYPCVSRSYALN